jgi:hypothetical protein
MRSGSSPNELDGLPGAQHALPQVTQAAKRVHQITGPGDRKPRGHRVDGEIPPGQVLLQRGAIPHGGLA